MSAFGHDTFKQDLLDEIEHLRKKYGLDKLEAVRDALEAVTYLLGESYRDVYQEVSASVQEAVKQSLINKSI